MQNITGLDIVMVLLIVGGSLNGLRIGAVRQVAGLVVFYLSVILTTRFYRLLLPSARNLLVGAPTAVLEAVIFVLILLVVYALLSVLLISMTTMRHPERGSKKQGRWHSSALTSSGESVAGTLNHLAGIPLGFFTAALWIGVGVLVYRFMISSNWLDWEDYRQKLAAGYQGSMLVPIFRSFLPYALKALEPWFPSGLPSIFLIN